jgi:hypothetical protein
MEGTQSTQIAQMAQRTAKERQRFFKEPLPLFRQRYLRVSASSAALEDMRRQDLSRGDGSADPSLRSG